MEEYQDWEDYIYTHQTTVTFVRFKGVEPFNELYAKGIITIYVTVVRVMYIGIKDVHYKVNKKGKLVEFTRFDVADESIEGEEPSKILSEEKNPYGWEAEQIRPKDFEKRYPKRD